MIARTVGLVLILAGAALGLSVVGVSNQRWTRTHDHLVRSGWLLVILGVFVSELGSRSA